jgi:hypothetical protein
MRRSNRDGEKLVLRGVHNVQRINGDYAQRDK